MGAEDLACEVICQAVEDYVLGERYRSGSFKRMHTIKIKTKHPNWDEKRVKAFIDSFVRGHCTDESYYTAKHFLFDKDSNFDCFARSRISQDWLKKQIDELMAKKLPSVLVLGSNQKIKKKANEISTIEDGVQFITNRIRFHLAETGKRKYVTNNEENTM